MSTLKIKNGDNSDKYMEVIGEGTLLSPYQSYTPDPRVPYAINQIFKNDAVTVSAQSKGKSLIKFGRNDDVGVTEELVWKTGGVEVYAAGNLINNVVSTNVGDTQTVTIEGHTLSGSDLTFVIQNLTLNGTTDVTLATPLYRATRIYNTDSTDFAGNIEVTESVSGDVHLSIEAGDTNQSLKCATSLQSTDYWLISSISCMVNRQNVRNVDFRIQVREFGKVFRTIYAPVAVSSNNGTTQIEFSQLLIVKPNSDFRVLATSSGTSTGVSCAVHGYLAEIV